MKSIVFFEPALLSLKKHQNVAPRLREKITPLCIRSGFARERSPQLRGSSMKRLRVGDFRILFEETETEIIVSKIGPRGSVYD